MKYCPKCGYENANDASFCARCGYRLYEVPNPVAPTPPPASQEQTKDMHNFNMTPEPMPPTYLWQAIVVTILCCWPLGIPAIVYASQVENKYRSGDFEGARRSSNYAKNFSIWSLVATVVVIIAYCIFIFALGLSGNFLDALSN